VLPPIGQRSAGWWGRPAHNLSRTFFKSKRLAANKGFVLCPMRYQDSNCGCNLAIYFSRSRDTVSSAELQSVFLFCLRRLQQRLAAK
jgi:hypothetical protein